MKTDPFRPLGYRFVVQFVDEPTEEAALARYERMSGKDKAARAKIVAGTWVGSPCQFGGEFQRVGAYKTGFRVYLPES